MDDLLGSLDEQEQQKKEQQDKQAQMDAVTKSGSEVAAAVHSNTEKMAKGLKDVKGEVKVTNPDLAKTTDIQAVINELKEVQLATLLGNSPKDAPVIQIDFADLGTKIAKLGDRIGSIATEMQNDTSDLQLTEKLDSLFTDFIKQLTNKLDSTTKDLQSTIKTIDIKPTVNVPATKVTVPDLDLSPIINGLSRLDKTLQSQEAPEKVDLSSVVSGLDEVRNSIQALRFPVPNYVLPFKDANGKAIQAPLDANGNQLVSGTLAPTPDVTPVSQNITVIDSTSSSAAGANNQTIIIGTPTAGSAASFALSSIETVRVEVTGIWTGTIATETSIDGGITWVNQGIHQGAYTTSSFTSGFVGGCNVSGATNFRIRATATITGTVVVKVVESVNTQSVYIANAAPSGNIISILNSSTATLTANSVYTGTAEDVSNFAEVRVSVKSNVASATDGLSIQQSPDGTNWNITDVYTIGTGGGTFTVPRQARYFRIVYTNGGTNQGSFNLQSILDRMPTASSSQRPSDARSNDNDMVEVLNYGNVYNSSANQWNRARDIGVAGYPAVGISDGTNVANVLKSDGTAAGQNSQMIANSFISVTFTTTTVQAVASTDAGNYRFVSVWISNQGTSSSIAFQVSNDNVTWAAVHLQVPGQTTVSTSSTFGSTMYYGPLPGRYFRLNVTGISAGTTNGTIIFSTLPSGLTAVGIGANGATVSLNPNAGVNLGNVGANSSTGSAVPTTAFYMGVSDGTNLRGLSSVQAVADTTAGVGMAAVGGYIYNGATWEKMRGDLGDASPATGLLVDNSLNWNNATYDRQRNNITAAVVAAGTSSTQTGITFTTYNAKRLMLLVNITSGAGSVTVAVNGTSASSYSTNLLTSTALSGVATTALRIFAGATPAANLVANDTIPRTVSITATVSGTVAFGIDYLLGV